MLDAHIIDSILREEQRREERRERVFLELPLPSFDIRDILERRRAPEPEEEDQGGPFVIPLCPDPEEREDAA